MKILKTTVILMLAAIFVFTGCEKDDYIPGENNNAPEKENHLTTSPGTDENTDILYSVTVKQGMLNFTDMEQLRKCNGQMAQMTKEELNEWEDYLSFTSQQRILGNALDAEFESFCTEDVEGMNKKELKQLYDKKQQQGYTDYTQKYIDAGIIKANSPEDLLSLELTVASWVHPRFLNQDGMVKVGSTIYQFTPTLCKELSKGDFSKLNILKKIQQDSPENNIRIGYLAETNKDFHGEIAFAQKDNGSSWGDKKIKASIWIRRWDYPSSGVKTYLYYLKYENYIYKWWNWKQDDKADTYGYAAVSTEWNSGRDYNYVNYSDNDWWSNNIHVLWLTEIPYNELVTFEDSNYSWFKRDDVTGINMNHSTIIL
jgi:hypothetical protein